MLERSGRLKLTGPVATAAANERGLGIAVCQQLAGRLTIDHDNGTTVTVDWQPSNSAARPCGSGCEAGGGDGPDVAHIGAAAASEHL